MQIEKLKVEVDNPVSIEKWTMRYRFLLSHSLTHDDDRIEFLLENQPIILGSKIPGTKLKKTTEFVVLAKGFASEKAALQFGERVRNALKLTSLFMGIGIDIGKDKATSGFAKSLKDAILQKEGIAWHDDIHGLSVYSEYPPPAIPTFSAMGSVSFSPQKFVTDFERAFAFAHCITVPEELELPINLYCASGMEKSHIGKLILALSAIEFIAARPARPEEEAKLLTTMHEVLEASEVSNDAKNNIRDALRNMERIGLATYFVAHLMMESLSLPITQKSVNTLIYNNINFKNALV